MADTDRMKVRQHASSPTRHEQRCPGAVVAPSMFGLTAEEAVEPPSAPRVPSVAVGPVQ
jgi:hypothetical protein